MRRIALPAILLLAIATLSMADRTFAGANVILKGEFNTSVAGWQLYEPAGPNTLTHIPNVDWASSPQSGSAEVRIFSPTTYSEQASTCMRIVGGTSYQLSLWMRIPSVNQAAGTNTYGGLWYYASTDCSGDWLINDGTPFNTQPDVWVNGTLTLGAPPTARSVVVMLNLHGSDPAGATQSYAFFDHVEVLGMAPSQTGDANCDGAINSLDALLALQFTAQLLLNLPCLISGDVNGSFSINAIDAALILQYNAGLIGSLPP